MMMLGKLYCYRYCFWNQLDCCRHHDRSLEQEGSYRVGWAWSLTEQAHALGIPVFMKEDLVPVIGDENMIQEMSEEFNKVLEVQRSWQK